MWLVLPKHEEHGLLLLLGGGSIPTIPALQHIEGHPCLIPYDMDIYFGSTRYYSNIYAPSCILEDYIHPSDLTR